MYTRRGDRGETSLFGPKRVRKDAPLVEAYGTIDELSSFIGVAISTAKDREVVSSLKTVQKLLFVAGADAASPSLKTKASRITEADTQTIERMTDDLLAKLPSLRNFILPGGTPTAASIQAARTVCRRAERRIVAASEAERVNPELVPFFNRLSSYLFNLSRFANMKAGRKEELWRG
ncbi:MAG: cob(I)yrinic acid a,c-diamide adenosyltransferase [archaeon]|nr:MAG: cob(I)yrinic acid a,c-diamide adenosyltransferase [archaeon]